MNDSGNDESSFDPDDQFFVEFLRELEIALMPDARDSILKKYSRQRPDLESVLSEMAQHEHNCQQSFRQGDSYSPPGQLGEFLIGRRIGIEGMGEVYEAYHERLERRVAVKIIRRGRTSDEAKKRFLREQRVLAKLHQTHIVPIHTAGEQDGLQFFAMPLIEGASLKSVVQAARQFSTANSAQATPSIARIVGSNMPSNAPDSKATEALPKFASNSVSPRTRIRYSEEYHTSVAQAMAVVADAVGYAHAAGVLHRDIKPHNIMIEPNGHVWVIDFGLAGFLQRASDTGQGTPTDADSRTSATVLSFDEEPKVTQRTLGGTAHYMAPERWENGKADVLSDVWALGATLYELLTLQRAFEGRTDDDIRQEILKHEPKAVKELVDGLPADLAAICRKAMHREPALRYQTAADLAVDLRRWLNLEPPSTRSILAPQRALLWVRRNPGWASLMGVMVVVGFVIATLSSSLAASNAEAKAKEMAHQRQMGIRVIERIQSTTHAKGWSDEIWNYGTTLPALEGEADLRDALATSLIDIDAEGIYEDTTTTADFLAFDEPGERLVCGGSTDDSGTLLQPPKVLELKTQKWHESTIDGSGPVASRKDRVPVVLVPDPENARRVRLFDVDTSQEITSFLQEGPTEKPTAENRPLLVLSTDAGFAVIATPLRDDVATPSTKDRRNGDFEVNVWDTITSERIHQCRVEGASSLAITPDGKVLAVGQANGLIGLWNIGNDVPFTDLPFGRHQVTSIAFAKDYLRRLAREVEPNPVVGWLLASGDNAGGLIVWDVALRQPRTVMRGSYYETSSLAFSHDSSLLFTAGRSPAHVWDVATGEQVLTWNHADYNAGLAITKNGMIATSGVEIFGHPPGVKIQKLFSDRGGIVLRGLRDVGRRLSVSHDGGMIAGLTITWQVGVWRSDGTLLHVFEAPVGPFADNATIAFSPDNHELFCCTGDRALTWNLDTGSVTRTWPVAPALINESAYTPDGKHLFLVRKEIVDRSRYPLSDAPPDRFPRIFRAYDLLSDGGSKTPILELDGFAVSAYRAQVANNGLLVLAGDTVPIQGKRASLQECWDLLTKQRLWSHPFNFLHNTSIDFSHQGKVLALSDKSNGSPTEIVDPRTGVAVKASQEVNVCDDKGLLSVSLTKFMPDNSDDRYVVLYAAGKPEPLVSFFFEASHAFDGEFFEYQNRTQLAWLNDKGHIVVADLEKIRSRLETVRLGW